MMWNYNAVAWLWMVPMMVVICGLVIAAIVVAVRASAPARQHGDEAVQILRRRLATGEITQDEFDRSRKLLQS
jgi:uncharacterized membrane protein